MTNPNCPRCRGKGQVEYQAKLSRGGVLTNTIAYTADCPRCHGAERFLTGAPKQDRMAP